jgi:hypothetical protein
MLPLTLDLPIGIGGVHSAISRAVGEFFEVATCQLFPSERLRADGQIFCPDAFWGDDFYEVKGSGQSRWIIEERQLDVYRELVEDGRGLMYVLWSYRGNPSLKSCCPTKRAVFEQLATRTTTCWILSMQAMITLLENCELYSFGYRNGDTTKYYRPRKASLPTDPYVDFEKLVVEIESVSFVLNTVRVIRCLERDSIVSDVPF